MLNANFFMQRLTVAISIVLYSGSSMADIQQDTSHHLVPIVLTAEKGNEANGLVVVKDPKQPIQPIPAIDGASYLQSIMGFNAVKSSGLANSDVTFRGMFGSRIKMLTNGSENLGACGGRMDSPTSYISPESFDKITVVKGPEIVRFANPGSAATVMFERDAVHLPEGKNIEGQASTVVGSFGRWDHNLDLTMGDSTKYLRVNANRSVSNDYKDGQGHNVHSNWEKWNTDISAGWTPDEDTWIEAIAGKADGEAAYAGRGMDGTKFGRESLGLHLQKKNINTFIQKIDAQVNYNFNDHIMDNYRMRPVKGMKMLSNVARETLNSRLEFTTIWTDRFTVLTGVDSQHNTHTSRGGLNYASIPRQKDMTFESYGAFAEGRYQLTDHQKIVSGARFDAVQVQDFRAKTQAFNQTRNTILPSGFLRLESQYPELNTNTYIGIGHVQRMPDYWEIFSPMSMATNGLKDVFNRVKPEKTTQIDLGYQYKHGALSHWVSAYVGQVNDFILMRYAPNRSVMNVNARIAGGEFGVDYAFTDHLQADVSGMYAWGENTTNRTALPQIAPFEARVNLNYVTEKYSLGALWRLVYAQHRYRENEGNVVGYDLGSSRGFGVLSINGTYQITTDMSLALGIDNVLNRNYTEHLNKLGAASAGNIGTEQINNIGRNYWAHLQVKF
ncbi:TonB-dependent copper receptor [Acinetobacter nectaris CIP 110549]|uniref:TonB-dependent copper receptor n=1 Tax=Acinetobacter nectaris CIP 110549 TaxID=1392540 RepID=V2T8B6_9GAMM|nr:TonB-dependent copper receptor [Acinetobacter nectaris]ESK38678.1 TonB-dependent copper receptor [Acinetobacter nectaris CIP 110549]